jgi:cytochrome c-type biogenesis protein CcmH/NrfG
MNARDLFWFFAGCASVIASAFIVIPIWRSVLLSANHRRLRTILVCVVVVTTAFISLLAYSQFGSPEALDRTPKAHMAMTATGHTDSLEVVTQHLASRLAREGGSDADWQLLAQSYEAAGDRDRAAAAKSHTATTHEVPVAGPQNSATATNAEQLRHAHKYAEAANAYAQAVSQGPLSADDYANYADVLATLGKGTFTAQAEHYIDRALELNPRHAKALWLKASAALKVERFRAALDTWQRLDAALPAESPDHEIVAANIREAQALVGHEIDKSPQRTTSATTVSGTIDLAPSLRAETSAGATLFIYAKAPDSPGPPLAVYKTNVTTWPVSFSLDDSLAMVPTRRLSAFDQVIIEARISRSGQALRERGDLFGSSAVVKTAAALPLHFTIDHRVE